MDSHSLSLRFADARLTPGMRLRYARQGDSTDDPIIFLHGFTDSWFSFSRVLSLMKGDHTSYALDQRGHGDSDRPETGYAMTDFASDVVAFMDAMGIKRATLVGHSMGTLAAQQVALTAPQRLARLVLIGGGTDARSEGVLGLQVAVETLRDPVPAEFAREFQVSTIYHPVPDDFLDRAVAESLKLPARVWREALAGLLAVDYAGQLGSIQMPTLILRGDHDDVIPRSAQGTLSSELAGAVVKVYPETGHALHWERPEQFAQDLEEFIAST